MRQSIFVGIIAVIGVLAGAYFLGIQYGIPSAPTGYRTIRFVGQIEEYSFEFSSQAAISSVLPRPEDPKHENYVFVGWYRVQQPETTDKAWDFNVPIWSGPVLTLYAVWEPVTYTVTFTGDDGWTLSTQEVIKGRKATQPEAPSNPGSIVAGWIDVETGRKWDFENDIVTESVTLQVRWIMDLRVFAVGANTTYILDNSGTVWAWGANRLLRPYAVDVISETSVSINRIFAGGSSLLAIDEFGYLWGTGDNSKGQLGVGTSVPFYSQLNPLDVKIVDPDNPETITVIPPDPEDPDSTETTLIETNWIRIKFISAAIGANHAMAIDTSGNLWAWGLNEDGQLGDGSKSSTIRTSPVKLNHGNRRYKEVFVGDSHTFAIDENDNLWAWGSNKYFQLARSSSTTESTVPVQIMNGTKFDRLAAGNTGNMAITKTGALLVWGIDANGYEAVEIGEGGFASVVAGPSYYLALLQDGRLYSWTLGENRVTPIVGDETDNLDQSGMSELLSDMTFVWIEGGHNHALALDADGNLWAWGSNAHGQLGNRTTTDSAIPIKIKLN